MTTSDEQIRPEEVSDEKERNMTAEEADEKVAEINTTPDKTEERDAGEEHHEDGPYQDDENPTVDDLPNKDKGDKIPEDVSPEPEMEKTSEPESEEKNDVPEPEADVPEKQVDELHPKENEDYEAFIHRYTNHPKTLQRISPAYRRAAADSVWRNAHK